MRNQFCPFQRNCGGFFEKLLRKGKNIECIVCNFANFWWSFVGITILVDWWNENMGEINFAHFGGIFEKF